MTRELTLRALDIPSIHRFGIGFDSIFDELQRTATQRDNYPPYNMIKYSDDEYAIEMAIAGFKRGDITVTVEKNLLTVKGEQIPGELEVPDGFEYLHQGISARNFIRTFTLAEHVEVKDAEVEDGILTIDLVRNVPEAQKPKNIQINYQNN